MFFRELNQIPSSNFLQRKIYHNQQKSHERPSSRLLKRKFLLIEASSATNISPVRIKSPKFPLTIAKQIFLQVLMMTSTMIPTIKPVKVVQHMLVIRNEWTTEVNCNKTTFKEISFNFFLCISLEFNIHVVFGIELKQFPTAQRISQLNSILMRSTFVRSFVQCLDIENEILAGSESENRAQ